MARPLTEAERAARIAVVSQQRAAGRTWKEIAADLGMPRVTLLNWCQANGLVPRALTKPGKAKEAARVTTQRECMGAGCRTMIASTGLGHRMCGDCARRAHTLSPMEPDPGGDTGRRTMARAGA